MNELPLCECGCGKQVTKEGNRFLKGHNGCKTSWMPKAKPQLCECGCCEYAKPGNKFIFGHNRRGKPHSDKSKKLMSIPNKENKNKHIRLLCKCGCGELASPGSDYIKGHYLRGEAYWKSQQEPTLCKCGCGKYASPGNDYILGHAMTDKKFSGEASNNLSNAQKGIPLSEINKLGISKALTKTWQEQPELWDGVHEKFKGGNDIVQHHYIYDDYDRLKYTVGMTRSDHTSLHRLLQKLNYIIPHINIYQEDN